MKPQSKGLKKDQIAALKPQKNVKVKSLLCSYSKQNVGNGSGRGWKLIVKLAIIKVKTLYLQTNHIRYLFSKQIVQKKKQKV